MPVIAIDPKGDLGNLLLTFPQLSRRGLPAVDRRRRGAPAGAVTPDAFAAARGRTLEERASRTWGQDGARIERLRDAADFAIYTPGSRAGVPVSILQSFAAPPRQAA